LQAAGSAPVFEQDLSVSEKALPEEAHLPEQSPQVAMPQAHLAAVFSQFEV
jgi:hypothetical protein